MAGLAGTLTTLACVFLKPLRHIEAHEGRTGIKAASLGNLNPSLGRLQSGGRGARPRTVSLTPKMPSEVGRHVACGASYVPETWRGVLAGDQSASG
jgi:hypothetical protein